MTTPHDTPRWVYIGGKLVQAKPDAPDHDSSPLYVLARDHAALVERCRVLEDALHDADQTLLRLGVTAWRKRHTAALFRRRAVMAYYAYGCEKLREGMRRAYELSGQYHQITHIRAAILAEMEKLP